VVRDDTGQRHGEVVAQSEVGLAGGLPFSAFQNLVNELVAFVAVLAEQGLDIFDRRRLERLEAVARVDAFGRSR
jgi:hypothetical protein